MATPANSTPAPARDVIETGAHRIELRVQHATRAWEGLAVDLDIALNSYAHLQAGENVAALHPTHNELTLRAAVCRAAFAAIDSPDAKLRDLPTLVRLLSLICGCHDPSWIRLDNERPADLCQTDLAFLAFYRQAMRQADPSRTERRRGKQNGKVG